MMNAIRLAFPRWAVVAAVLVITSPLVAQTYFGGTGTGTYWFGAYLSGSVTGHQYRANVSPSTRLDLGVSGTRLDLQLYCSGSCSTVLASVDGTAAQPIPLITNSGWRWYTVFTGLADTSHRVTVVNGAHAVDAYSFARVYGSAAALVVPPGYGQLMTVQDQSRGPSPFVGVGQLDPYHDLISSGGAPTVRWMDGDMGIRFNATPDTTNIQTWAPDTQPVALLEDGQLVGTQQGGSCSGDYALLNFPANPPDGNSHLFELVIGRGAAPSLTASHLQCGQSSGYTNQAYQIMIGGGAIGAPVSPRPCYFQFYGDSLTANDTWSAPNSGQHSASWEVGRALGCATERFSADGKSVASARDNQWLLRNADMAKAATIAPNIFEVNGGFDDMVLGTPLPAFTANYQAMLSTIAAQLVMQAPCNSQTCTILSAGIYPCSSSVTKGCGSRSQYIEAQENAVAGYMASDVNSPANGGRIPAVLFDTTGWYAANASSSDVNHHDYMRPTSQGFDRVSAKEIPIWCSHLSGCSPYTVSGPSTGNAGVASAPFTLELLATPNDPYQSHATFTANYSSSDKSTTPYDSVTLSDGGAGGAFAASSACGHTKFTAGNPVTVAPTSGDSCFSFTYTPATEGTTSIKITNHQDLPSGNQWHDVAPLTYVAAPGYTVTANEVGSGTIASTDGLLNCGAVCSRNYVSGSVVTLAAVAASGSTSVRWSGCDAVSANVCTVTVNGDRAPTADFSFAPAIGFASPATGSRRAATMALSATASSNPALTALDVTPQVPNHQNYPNIRTFQWEYNPLWDASPAWYGSHVDVNNNPNANLSAYQCPASPVGPCTAQTVYLESQIQTYFYYQEVLAPAVSLGFADPERIYLHITNQDYSASASGTFSGLDQFDIAEKVNSFADSNSANATADSVNGALTQNSSGKYTDVTACLYSGNCSGNVVLNTSTPYLYLGYGEPYDQINVTVTSASSPTVTWQYWNGSAWVNMPLASDGTSGMKASGRIALNPTGTNPFPWARLAISGTGITSTGAGYPNNTTQPKFWTRLNVASGSVTISKVAGDNLLSTYSNSNCGGACQYRAWCSAGWVSSGSLMIEKFKYNPSPAASCSARFEWQARSWIGASYQNLNIPNYRYIDPATGKNQYAYSASALVDGTKLYDTATYVNANGTMWDDFAVAPSTTPNFTYNNSDEGCAPSCGAIAVVDEADVTTAFRPASGTGLYQLVKANHGSTFLQTCNMSQILASPTSWQLCDITWQEGTYANTWLAADSLSSSHSWKYYDIPRDNPNPNNALKGYATTDNQVGFGTGNANSANNIHNADNSQRTPMLALTSFYVFTPGNAAMFGYSFGNFSYSASDGYGKLNGSTVLTAQLNPTLFSITAAGNASSGSTSYTTNVGGWGTNALAGKSISIGGFSGASADNGTFTIQANTATSITVNNANGVANTPTNPAVGSFNPNGTIVSMADTTSTGLPNPNFTSGRDAPPGCQGATACRIMRLCTPAAVAANTCDQPGNGQWLIGNITTTGIPGTVTVASTPFGESIAAIMQTWPVGTVVQNFGHGSLSVDWPTDASTPPNWHNVLYWTHQFPAIYYDIGVPDTSSATGWCGVNAGTACSGGGVSNSVSSCNKTTTQYPGGCSFGDRDTNYRVGTAASGHTSCGAAGQGCAPTYRRDYMRGDGKQVVMLLRLDGSGDWQNEYETLGKPIDLMSGSISGGGENLFGPYQQLFADGTLGTPLNSCIVNGSTCVATGVPNGHQIIQLPGTTSVILVQQSGSPSPSIITPSPLPAGAIGESYALTLTATGGTPPYSQWTVSSGSLPSGVSLNSSTGVISGTPATAGTTTFNVTVQDSASTTSAPASLSLTLNPRLTAVTATLPNGPLNAAYSTTLASMGGVGITTWSLVSGSLPAGLSLNSSTGVISGIPTAAGTFSIVAEVSDAGITNCTGANAPACVSLSLTITSSAPSVSTTSPLPTGAVGETYSLALAASGGVAPYSNWTVSSGSLPTGLSVNSSTGMLSGTPASAGGATFSVTVKDSVSNTSAPASLSVTLNSRLTAATTTLPNGTVTTAYNATMTSTGGIGSTTWSLASGSLPAGLSLNALTGVLSGTPTTAGTYRFVAEVSDAGITNCTGANSPACASLSITISSVPIITTPSPLPTGAIGESYSVTLAATGGVPPYSNWTVTSGSLPAGLSMNSSTGVISGTPTTPGSTNFSVTVKDSASMTSIAASLSVTLNSRLTAATATLPDGAVAMAYTTTLTSTGGVGSTAWSIASGSLPAGLSLNSSTGVISGTPTTGGTYSFVAEVSDAGITNCTGANSPACASFSITVTSIPPTITTPSLPAGAVGESYGVTLAATGGAPPYSNWTITSGYQSVGLSLNSSTGVISGTPTISGTATVAITVQDNARNTSAPASLSVTLNPRLTSTTGSLPSGTRSSAYSFTLASSGGVGTKTWSLASGSLPPGISLNSTTGIIAGTPTTSGTYYFVVEVSDSGIKNCSGANSPACSALSLVIR